MDKISVIIPVYNVEKYISKCVESVMAQSYDNLEIILVNDGATDQSGVLCDYYAQQDSRIIVIHKEMADFRMPEIADWIALRESMYFSLMLTTI